MQGGGDFDGRMTSSSGLMESIFPKKCDRVGRQSWEREGSEEGMIYCPRRWCVDRIMVHPHPNHWKVGMGAYTEKGTLWV